MPVQVWATWFQPDATPLTLIQGFPVNDLDLTAKGRSPFHLKIGDNAIEENSCKGRLEIDGHSVSWDIKYHSNFRTTLSNKGWIGFSRSPHSDAVFSGQISLDGKVTTGDPLGFGAQGHNCGYRHRTFWKWTHVYLEPKNDEAPTTLEALLYDMPFGMIFRKAVLWHEGTKYEFRNLSEVKTGVHDFHWSFRANNKDGFRIEVLIDGNGPALHRLPYLKTDCSSNIEVANNSCARARIRLQQRNGRAEILETVTGAVLEMGGHCPHF